MHSVIIACTITTLSTTYIYIASFKVQLSQQLHCSVSYRWGYRNSVHDKDRRRGIQPQRNSASPSSAEAGDFAPALPEQRQVPGSHLRPSPHVVGAHPVRGRLLQKASQPDACHGGLALG